MFAGVVADGIGGNHLILYQNFTSDCATSVFLLNRLLTSMDLSKSEHDAFVNIIKSFRGSAKNKVSRPFYQSINRPINPSS